MANYTVILDAIARQRAYREDPRGFRPRPLIFSSAYPGKGFGNFLGFFTQHVAMALFLKRPLLVRLDEWTDPYSALGWNSTTDGNGFLRPRRDVFDWTLSLPLLLAENNDGRRDFQENTIATTVTHELLRSLRANYTSPLHVSLTCRETRWNRPEFVEACANHDRPSFNGPAIDFLMSEKSSNLYLYSEYGASFQQPAHNTLPFLEWKQSQIGSFLLPAVFNLMFEWSEDFLIRDVFPHLNAIYGPHPENERGLSGEPIFSYFRLGSYEVSRHRRGDLENLTRSLRECRRAFPASKWVFLGDDGELAEASSNFTYATLNASFSLSSGHTVSCPFASRPCAVDFNAARASKTIRASISRRRRPRASPSCEGGERR